jgi:hypothetical protein
MVCYTSTTNVPSLVELVATGALPVCTNVSLTVSNAIIKRRLWRKLNDY